MTPKNFVRLCLLACGAILLVWGFSVWQITNFNLGNVLMLMLGAGLSLLGLLLPRLPRWFTALIALGLTLLLSLCAFLFAFSRADSGIADTDAAIVLGAGLRGENVSLTLKKRLDRAIDYAQSCPDALIVVSGGQGAGESIPEAEAMSRYLIAHGIAGERIIKEAASTSTRENFRFSKVLLDELLKPGYRITYITTDFHAYRAGLLAREEGFEEPARLCSTLHWYLYPANYLRESLAVCKTWLIG